MKPEIKNASDLKPLLDTQQNQLGQLFDQGNSIDAKALAILASNVALLIFIEQSVGEAALWQLTLLLAPFLLSLAFNLVAIWPRSYEGHSVKLEEHPEYLHMNEDQLTLQLLADTQQAIRTNRLINRKRWRYFTYSLVLAALGTAIILIYFN